MATNLVAVVLFFLVVRGIIFLVQKSRAREIGQGFNVQLLGKYLSCFISGVLLTNAIPHFVHGISGENFPAPFGPYLVSGFPQHLANVIWGFLNIVFGYNQFVMGEVASPDTWRKFFFFAGVLGMGIFLCFVFSR